MRDKNTLEPNTQTKRDETMEPQIFKVQDIHSKNKAHCYKFYACGHVHYNQEIRGIPRRSSWSRLYLSYYSNNGYHKYYIQAKAEYDRFIKKSK